MDRAIKFRFDIEPMSAVRMRQKGSFASKAAARYMAWKNQMRHDLTIMMLEQKLQNSVLSAIGVPRITFYMPIPESGKAITIVDGQKKRVTIKEDMYHTNKPDIDGLEKAIFDVFNGIYWHDDCQVCHVGEKRKVYSDKPGIEIEVTEL